MVPELRRNDWLKLALQIIMMLIALAGVFRYLFLDVVDSEHRSSDIETRLSTVENAVLELKELNMRLERKQDRSTETLAQVSGVLEILKELHMNAERSAKQRN